MLPWRCLSVALFSTVVVLLRCMEHGACHPTQHTLSRALAAFASTSMPSTASAPRERVAMIFPGWLLTSDGRR